MQSGMESQSSGELDCASAAVADSGTVIGIATPPSRPSLDSIPCNTVVGWSAAPYGGGEKQQRLESLAQGSCFRARHQRLPRHRACKKAHTGRCSAPIQYITQEVLRLALFGNIHVSGATCTLIGGGKLKDFIK